MDPLPPPLAFVLQLCSGWINRHQQAVIDYLLEENRVVPAEKFVLVAAVDVAGGGGYASWP
jgi:hypothetical protein